MTPLSGKEPLELDGFSYLPGFASAEEGEELAAAFGALHPIWEHRHAPDDRPRQGGGDRRLTRPVYWLRGWQFASLGYYAEPDHKDDRCVQAEDFPPIVRRLIDRLEPHVLARHTAGAELPAYNSGLVNFYGSEVEGHRVQDMARLRAHRDAEPGPVVMFCVGQPGLLEFVDEPRGGDVALSLWTRHRSVVVFSGARFKDQLYHRITRVRHGKEPVLHCPLPDFRVRRISLSLRHVPEQHITPLGALSPDARAKVLPYVQQLAEHSAFFRQQLAGLADNDASGGE